MRSRSRRAEQCETWLLEGLFKTALLEGLLLTPSFVSWPWRGIYKLETRWLYRAIGRSCPINCTPGRRCVSLLVKPSHWNITSRWCTSPLCSICFAAKLMGTQLAIHCVSSLYLPLRSWLSFHLTVIVQSSGGCMEVRSCRSLSMCSSHSLQQVGLAPLCCTVSERRAIRSEPYTALYGSGLGILVPPVVWQTPVYYRALKWEHNSEQVEGRY